MWGVNIIIKILRNMKQFIKSVLDTEGKQKVFDSLYIRICWLSWKVKTTITIIILVVTMIGVVQALPAKK